MSESRTNAELPRITIEQTNAIAAQNLDVADTLRLLVAMINNVALQACAGDRDKAGRFIAACVIPVMSSSAIKFIELGGVADIDAVATAGLH